MYLKINTSFYSTSRSYFNHIFGLSLLKDFNHIFGLSLLKDFNHIFGLSLLKDFFTWNQKKLQMINICIGGGISMLRLIWPISEGSKRLI